MLRKTLKNRRNYAKYRKRNANTSRTGRLAFSTYFAPAKRPAVSAFNGESSLQITRMVQFTNVNQNNVAAVGVSYSFQLSDLPSFADFTALFDSYRIDEVELTMIPGWTQFDNNTMALVLSVVDFDDATVSTDLSAFLQSENVQQHTPHEPIRIKLKPKFATAAFSGAFTSYSVSQGWVDCGSPSVQHYGIKLFLGALQGAATNNTWLVTARYKISLRAAR